MSATIASSPSAALATVPAAPPAAPVRRAHPRVVRPSLRLADSPAAHVFSAVRSHGPIVREAIVSATALSAATVNRQVTALLRAGVLRERPDLVSPGAIGRPRIPLSVNNDPFLTVGLHIGARTTSIAASDLLGHTLDVVEIPTPRGAQESALASLAESTRRYLRRWSKRTALWLGIAIGGSVDADTGYVDHRRLGWAQAPVGPVFADESGLPVSVASHVDAMAGAELLLGGPRPPTARFKGATSLYVYARETVGYALVIDGRVHSPAGGPGTMAGLPASSELLGGDGLLESVVSDRAVLTAARRLRLLSDGRGNTRPGTPLAEVSGLAQRARSGSPGARTVLGERSRVLGEAIALLRDLLNPADIVVGGQAFTDYPEGVEDLTAAYTARSLLPGPPPVRVTAFGARVQEAGAGAVSLSGVYADPVAAMRRARAAGGRLGVPVVSSA